VAELFQALVQKKIPRADTVCAPAGGKFRRTSVESLDLGNIRIFEQPWHTIKRA
jgi:hypothetical protein